MDCNTRVQLEKDGWQLEWSPREAVTFILKHCSLPESWRDQSRCPCVHVSPGCAAESSSHSLPETSPTHLPSHCPTPGLASSTFDSNYLFAHPLPQQSAHLLKGWSGYLLLPCLFALSSQAHSRLSVNIC